MQIDQIDVGWGIGPIIFKTLISVSIVWICRADNLHPQKYVRYLYSLSVVWGTRVQDITQII